MPMALQHAGDVRRAPDCFGAQLELYVLPLLLYVVFVITSPNDFDQKFILALKFIDLQSFGPW